MNRYGLSAEEQDEIDSIFKKYIEIEEVILFGSRAMNTFTTISDIDFAVKGKTVSSIIGALKSDFESSSIIYEVDVLNYHNISSEALLEHIRKFGKVFYRKGLVETTLGEVVTFQRGSDLQKKDIAARVLSSFDEKIELLREQNETLETIAQTIFKEWFVNLNYPNATGEMVDSELGKIPKGWRVDNLIKTYSKVVNKLLEKVNVNLNQIQTLTEIRDTLLPKLMSGEIRVQRYDQ